MTSIDMTQTLRPRSSAKSPKAGRKETRGGGIEVERFYTKPGVDVYDTCEWELRSAVITSESGGVVFEQKDVEMPKFWSQMATNVVVSKYFRGHIGEPDRERSVRQLIGRVVRTITGFGREGGYFATEEDGDAFRSSRSFDSMKSRMSGWSMLRMTIFAARRVFPPDLITPANES